MVKNYVLDTNILLQTEGRVIYGLDDNIVTIPGIVLEELDNIKSAPGEKGFAARECIRKIAAFNPEEEKGELRIMTSAYSFSGIPDDWNRTKPDNIILATVQNIISNNTNGPVILITNDIAMHIKAKQLGIDVQDYKNDQTQETEEYTGRGEADNLPDELIDELYSNEEIKRPDNIDKDKYYILKSVSGKSALVRTNEDSMILIRKDNYEDVYGISPKNAGQTFAMDALTAPVDDVPLVILKGCAGTGKTILSLAVAMQQMSSGMYDKIIITRSNTLSDEEIGFLPGDLEAKMGPLLAPFYDNLRHLLKMNGECDEQVNMLIDDMIERGSIEIVSLAYIRGRSIPNAFIIVDEVQNLSVTQTKTLITRCGIGSKLVLLGDVGQIDAPRLDRRSNGLSYVSEKFKGCGGKNGLCRQMTFTSSESVRSPLSSLAIELLEN